jgi:hypothetical protein
MSDPLNHESIILTLVRSPKDIAPARLMIESLRSFGGTLSQHPVWLFEANSQNAPCGDLAGEGVRVIPLRVMESVSGYLYADKVAACAQAEESVSPEVRSLIWIDPACLVVNPPALFELDTSHDAAVRPVHIRNVGLPPQEPLDGFWAQVCAAVGVADIHTTVETFVDAQRIRSYFNTHALAVNPSTGLLSQWFEAFETLVNDKEYQRYACQDVLHKIFLHQAVFSALLATRIEQERLRILPPDYNYPYNLQAKVIPSRRAERLNDLVCIAYEERSLNPEQVDDIRIDEPLRSWLAARTALEE